MSAAGTKASGADGQEQDRRTELLAGRTEAGRLGRAAKLTGKVSLAIAEPDLVIAAVGNYNVVIDATAHRIQHSCRDFQGQFREGRICKHVAALLLALDEDLALPILESLADPTARWSLEVIQTFRPR